MKKRKNGWSKQQLAMLGKSSDADIAALVGKDPVTVAQQRYRKGIDAFQKQKPWTPEQVALLGTMTDAHVANATGRKTMAVYTARRERKIPAFNKAQAHGGGKPTHKQKETP